MPIPSAGLVNPIYMPALRDIASITQAFPALVTTTFDHGYITGNIVRLYIPKNFGMQQANKLKGSIAVQSPTSFTIAIDTTHMDAFVIPPLQPGFNYTPAQCVPIGEDTDTLKSAFVNVLTPLF